MEGSTPSGRPRIGMIDDLKKGLYIRMKMRAEDRVAWRSWMQGTCLKAQCRELIMTVMTLRSNIAKQ